MVRAKQQKLESSIIEIAHSSGVVELRLNRPDTLNAFSSGMYLQAAAALNKHSGDAQTRIIVLTAAGRSFCSGMDIREASKAQHLDKLLSSARVFMNALMNCSRPLIAAAFGNVTGIGVTMLLHCDVVFVDKATQFQTPFANIGIVPEFASSVLFPIFLGPSLSSRLLLCGETVDAEQMQRAGCLQLVESDVSSAAVNYAISWSRKFDLDQWEAVLEAKRLIRVPIRHKVTSAIDAEFQTINKLYHSGALKRLLVSKAKQLTSRKAML